jgi:two-component system, NtrC family, nitrogen regulation sensor histidine kinase GlnL
MLAHEIKNPLSGIRGAAQLLDKAVGADGNALTKLIRDEVDRIATLIDRMEAFTDGRPLIGRPENIYSILDHVRALAESGFGDKIDIRVSYDPSLPSVLVDRDSMIQIVLNLLKNAAEAVPSGKRGVVTLSTGYRHGVSIPGEGGQRLSVPIELCVIDDGPGPPPEIAEHLFEPFVSSKSSGRGLGLALVDKLVRDNGGIIQFAREGQPARTVFRLLLPRAQ